MRRQPHIVHTLVLFILSFALVPPAITIAQTGEDSPARAISSPEFKMSPEAVAAGIDGKLIVEVAVSKTGKVTKANVLSGPAWPCNSFPEAEIKKVRAQVEDILLQ